MTNRYLELPIQPGDKVIIKASGIEAVIQKVIVDLEVMYYECQWWVNESAYSMNFYQSEIEKLDVNYSNNI